jgi:hypothetical protein
MLLQVTAQLDSVEPPISLTVLKKKINKNKVLDVDTKSHMFTAIHTIPYIMQYIPIHTNTHQYTPGVLNLLVLAYPQIIKLLFGVLP